MMKRLVREAISRELRRGGQVYYVYNRVTDIDEVARQDCGSLCRRPGWILPMDR